MKPIKKNKMLRTRKAQFYMFAAIVFISAVFVIVANKSTISLDEIEDFTTYKQNYVHEAQIILNNAIYENKNLSSELSSFTEDFLSYMNTKNQDIGILFMYSYNDKIYVGNYLNEPVIINPGGNLAEEEKKSLDFKNTVSINYRNETFNYGFSDPEKIMLKSLFVKQ